MRNAILLVTVITLLGGGGPARAQSNPRQIPLLSFDPAIHPDGVITTDPSATLGHLRWSMALWLGYANDPLKVTLNGTTLYKPVHHQALANVTVGFGIWHYFEIGVDLPVVLYQTDAGDPNAVGGMAPLDSMAVGDFRIAPKVRFWKNTPHGFGLALVPQLTIPSGMDGAHATDGRVSFEPRVVLDYRFRDGSLIAANLGYRLRKQVQVSDLRVDDEFYYALGVELMIWQRRLSLLGEIYGAVGFTDSPRDADQGVDLQEAPMEALFGMRYRSKVGLMIAAGAGFGVTSGYGTPDYRIFLQLGYRSPAGTAAPPKPRPGPTADRDGDGIPDVRDRCPDDAEDKDGHEDQDGCPDPDNDKDGVCDPNPVIQKHVDDYAKVCHGVDHAPNDPEDRDGFADDDGTPDPDNDKDGVCDPNPLIQRNLARYAKVCKGVDRAPNDPEDRDGFADGDGTPDPDNDKDGVCDPNPVIQRNLARYAAVCKGKDRAPFLAEDRDGHQDDDGVPDPDNDADGFCDDNPTIQNDLAAYRNVCQGRDRCSNEAEIINGVKDDDGCPDKGKAKLIITRKAIRILQKIYFRTNRARIRRRSHGILRVVAKVLKANPWIARVQVEGHTDERGPARRNQRLSQRRAEAVRQFLMKAGVAGDRLVARGFGEERPVQAGCRKLRHRRRRRACHAKNRRVAFTILKTLAPGTRSSGSPQAPGATPPRSPARPRPAARPTPVK